MLHFSFVSPFEGQSFVSQIKFANLKDLQTFAESAFHQYGMQSVHRSPNQTTCLGWANSYGEKIFIHSDEEIEPSGI